MDVIVLEIPLPPVFAGPGTTVIGGRPVPSEIEVAPLPIITMPESDGERVFVEEAYRLLKNPMLTAFHLNAPVLSIKPLPNNAYLVGLAPGYGEPRTLFHDDVVRLRVTFNGRLQAGEIRLQQAFARSHMRLLNGRNRYAG